MRTFRNTNFFKTFNPKKMHVEKLCKKLAFYVKNCTRHNSFKVVTFFNHLGFGGIEVEGGPKRFLITNFKVFDSL
jgi:hypothetical protein